MKRPELSPVTLILVTTALIIFANNLKLWGALGEQLDLLSLNGAGYAISFYLLILTVTILPILLLGQKWLLKPVLIFVIILSAVLSYFTQTLGVVFDDEMWRNVLDNIREANKKEAMDLVSLPLLGYLALLAALPTLLVLMVKVKAEGWWKGLGKRLGTAVVLLAVTAGLVLLNFKYVTYFSREHRDLRVYVTPVFAMTSAIKLYRKTHATPATFTTITGTAAAKDPAARRTVGILAVGETARADHFSLNGYPRPTNPLLEKVDGLISFHNASSCGTSTAFSVPCMFSFLTRDNYTPEKAGYQSNALDVLHSAKVKVLWVDNNSGCKNVCDRLGEGTYIANTDGEEAQDDYLLTELDKVLANIDRDTLIVLHMVGSHGPAYYKRYSPDKAVFKPYCASNAPQDCSLQDIANAYDNTIAYSDHILDGIIQRLKQQDNQFDSFMLYASDHGESLGENGIYLHGLPYALAPEAQTHIPMIFWASAGFTQNSNGAVDALRQAVDKPVSHDNLSQTMLGAFHVSSPAYQPELDLLKR
jgi:lipid A ethanolaminephosphotransferase